MTISSRVGFKLQDTEGKAIRLTATPASHVTISAANAPCTLSFATVDGYQWSPGLLLANYDASVTVGNVQVQDYAGNVYLNTPVTSLFSENLDKILLPVSTGMKIELKAGGAGKLGYLNCYPHYDR